jgi:hypothetical protein
MSQHHHTWQVEYYVLLSLPTRQNLSERYIQWHCACGAWLMLNGEFRPGTPLGLPEQWQVYAAREQQQQTPEARQARRQMARKIVQRRPPRGPGGPR